MRDLDRGPTSAVHGPDQRPARNQRQVERRQGRPDDDGGLLLFRRQTPAPETTRSRRTTRATRRQRRFGGDLRAAGERAAQGPCDGSPYNSPVIDGSCGQNFIIYISNGAAQDNNSTTARHDAARAARPKAATPPTIPISPSRLAEQHGGRMGPVHGAASPYGITTYTVDVDKVTTGQGPGWTALLKSMARVSKGKYFDVSSAGAGAADPQAALADYLLRDPGRQQRVRLGQLAGQRQHRGHVPEPDLHRHVPPG